MRVVSLLPSATDDKGCPVWQFDVDRDSTHDLALEGILRHVGRQPPGILDHQSYSREAISQRDYSLPYSPTMIKQEEKLFDNIKAQGVLDGIDKLIGVGGTPGYLDTVVSLAQRAQICSQVA